MPKMHQNAPRPAGGAYALPRPPSRNGSLLLRGGKRGEGGYFKGVRKGGKGKGFPPKVKVSRIKAERHYGDRGTLYPKFRTCTPCTPQVKDAAYVKILSKRL